MALLKYKDLLAMAKDKIKETMAPLRAREMKIKGQLEVAKLDGVIAEKEQKIQEYASEYPVDYIKLLDSLDDLALTERRKAQFEKIIAEMFDESVTE